MVGRYVCFRIRFAGETACKVGIVGGQIADYLQFFALTIDIVRQDIRARGVLRNALVYLFGNIQKVDGLFDKERIVECARAFHTRNVPFYAFYADIAACVYLGRINACARFLRRGYELVVDIHDGDAV